MENFKMKKGVIVYKSHDVYRGHFILFPKYIHSHVSDQHNVSLKFSRICYKLKSLTFFYGIEDEILMNSRYPCKLGGFFSENRFANFIKAEDLISCKISIRCDSRLDIKRLNKMPKDILCRLSMMQSFQNT